MIFQCNVWDIPIVKCYLLLVGSSRLAGVLSLPGSPLWVGAVPFESLWTESQLLGYGFVDDSRKRVDFSADTSSMQKPEKQEGRRPLPRRGDTPGSLLANPSAPGLGTLLLSLESEPWVPLEYPSTGTSGSLSSVPLAAAAGLRPQCLKRAGW